MDVHEHQDASLAGTRLGDYTLLGRIGRGGQGDVYEARQESLGRRVALKVLSSRLTLNPESLQRFRREAAAGGRLTHPNIVAVHAVGEAGDVRFIAQELVEGGRTLADLLDGARRQPERPRGWYELVARLFVDVADALHSAHEAGIIHRDVKPGNILITQDGRPKVADFGLALVEDDLLRSRSGELVGTPFYMSPEQVAGKRPGLDHRTDVFSLGTSLYEALTLRRPFEGDSRERIIQQILLHDPPDPRRLHGHVPRELAVICMKALEKRAERRYASAAALAADLRRHLASEPILARPPGRLARTAKWARRHPVASVGGSVAVTAFVIVTALYVETLAAWKLADQESDQATSMLNALVAQMANFDPTRGAADPDYGRAFLDRAIEAADELSPRPDRQAQLLFNLAFAYRNRVLYEQALPLFERALALSEEAYGPDDVRAVHAMFCLGSTQRLLGRWADARPTLEEAQRRLDAHADPPGPLVAGMLAERGLVCAGEGRLAEAEDLLRRAVRTPMEAAELGYDAEFVPMTELSLGHVLMARGRLDDAATLIRRARDAAVESGTSFQRMRGTQYLAELRMQQAGAARASGDEALASAHAAESEALFLAARDDARHLLGTRHVDYAKIVSNLGVLYRRQGRLDEARPLLEEALAVLEELRTADDAEVLYVRNNLGTLAFTQGRTADAESAWRAIVEGRRAGEDLEPVISALANLTKLLAHSGRHAEAVVLARDLYARTPPEDRRRDERRRLLESLEALAVSVSQDP